MSDWLIALPAWGERCVDLAVDRALPSIRAALSGISGRVRFVIHTDHPQRIENALGDLRHELYGVPTGKTPHHSAGMANRDVLALALPGECVALINADMVASCEVFAAAEKRFAAGKRLIMMAASRTLGGEPPIGVKSAELLRWTMQHRHPAIRECFWETGRTSVPWAVYFERGDEIVLHGFHLHPFAVVKDRDMAFKGVTIDFDLADNFKPDEIHLVTDIDEAAFAEISPPDRVFQLNVSPISVASVARWARNATPLHRWLFAQPIAITGNGGDIGDRDVCAEILDLVSRAPAPRPVVRRRAGTR